MQIYKTSKARENILRKIRMSLQEESLPVPYPEAEKQKLNSFFQPLSMPSREETFAQEFTNSGGHFIFCSNEEEAIQNFDLLVKKNGWNEVLCANKRLFSFLIHHKLSYIREYNPLNETAPACITDCEAAIARTGSILLSSRQNHGRTASVYYPVHLVLLFAHQIVDDIDDGLQLVKQRYKGRLPSMISLETGPSRTTEIENTLVTGAHGPKEVFCFFLNQ